MTDAPEKIWADPDHWVEYPPDGLDRDISEYTEYTRTDLHLALVAAAYEAAATTLDKHDGVPCEAVCREIWSNERLTAYEAGQIDASLSWQKAIRALTPDDAQGALEKVKRKARNEAIEQAILAVNGCDRVSEVQPALRKLKEDTDDE